MANYNPYNLYTDYTPLFTHVNAAPPSQTMSDLYNNLVSSKIQGRASSSKYRKIIPAGKTEMQFPTGKDAFKVTPQTVVTNNAANTANAANIADKSTLKQVLTQGVDKVDDWVKGKLNSWDPKTGWGGKYAKGANTLAAIGQGVQAVGGLAQNVKQGRIVDDLESQILAAYGNNPLANSMLNSEQLAQIRRLKNGYSNNDASFNDVLGGIGQDLPSILMGTAMGAATGGVPGALISGVGGLVNSGIKGFGQGQSKQTSELEGLYNALLNAEQQYKGMVMPSSYGIPLRAPYNNMYM